MRKPQTRKSQPGFKNYKFLKLAKKLAVFSNSGVSLKICSKTVFLSKPTTPRRNAMRSSRVLAADLKVGRPRFGTLSKQERV